MAAPRRQSQCQTTRAQRPTGRRCTHLHRPLRPARLRSRFCQGGVCPVCNTCASAPQVLRVQQLERPVTPPGSLVPAAQLVLASLQHFLQVLGYMLWNGQGRP